MIGELHSLQHRSFSDIDSYHGSLIHLSFHLLPEGDGCVTGYLGIAALETLDRSPPIRSANNRYIAGNLCL